MPNLKIISRGSKVMTKVKVFQNAGQKPPSRSLLRSIFFGGKACHM